MEPDLDTLPDGAEEVDLERLREIGTGDYPGHITGEWIRVWEFDGRRFEVVGGVGDDKEFRVSRAVGVSGHSGVLGFLDVFAEDDVASVVWSQPRDCGHHRYAVTGSVADANVLLEIARGLHEVSA